jgi:prephenate dehydrogenase
VINKLCIFGVGLIGGSLALALKKAGYCKTIIGCSRNEAHLQRAVELGVIDSYTLDQQEAVKSADVVLLAVPIRSIGGILSTIAGSIDENTIITDAGSAKGSVINAVKEAFDGVIPANFVAGHPIAGREKSSVEAAISDLYLNHKVVLTPTVETSEVALNIVRDMWLSTGAIVELLPSKHHDDVLAATSHLPHILAYTFVNSLSKSDYGEAVFDYAAGGFKSFSRTASSDAIMWRDICLDNKTAILDALDAYQTDLAKIKDAIVKSDSEDIETLFMQAKTTRDRIFNKS